MGKAGAAMAMVATAPCQAEVYGPGGKGGGGGEEGGVGGGDVAVTKRVTATTEARRQECEEREWKVRVFFPRVRRKHPLYLESWTTPPSG